MGNPSLRYFVCHSQLRTVSRCTQRAYFRRNLLAKSFEGSLIVMDLFMKSIIFVVLCFCELLISVRPAFAQNWTQSTYSFLTWTAVASSADGKRIWGALTNGPIFFSTNSGATWGVVNWTNWYYTTGLASSPNGNVLAAVTGFRTAGKIYVSTDSGANWPETTAPLEYWTSIACSADGRKLVAAATNGSVYISTDTGQTWAPSSPPVNHWISITSSADGNQLAVVSPNGILCVSTNGGNSWATNNPNSSNLTLPLAQMHSPQFTSDAPNTNWQAVTCSADKRRLVAVVNGGPIYISTDAGVSWTASSAPSANWQAVASSADGSRLIAAANNGPVYTSTDSGATWVSNSIPSSPWVSVASSADGSKLVAAAGPVQFKSKIYTLYNAPSPRLNLTSLSNQVGLAWTLPGTNFVLQQNAGLGTANWVTLTNTLTLNLSNLQYQLNLSPSNSSGFFRLSTP
jgi:photosystem II stability/assembly factor-like uncharacterized protein